MTYQADPRFNKKAVYQSEAWDEVFTVRGEEGLATALQLAGEHVKTGSFEAHMHGEFSRAKNQHPYYRISNDDPAAVSIEFGTAHTDGLHVLRRTLDAMEE